MKTFDIWLEDSQGRQFRRSNHYHCDAETTTETVLRYYAMRRTLQVAGLRTTVNCKSFNY